MELIAIIASQVLVLFFLMIGSGIGDQIAGFIFGQVKGKLTRIIYMLLFMPLFVLGGYAYVLLGISRSLFSTALFFGLWGFASVFVSRFVIYLGSKLMDLRLSKAKKSFINAKELIKYLKKEDMKEYEIRQILAKSCESERKAQKVFEGGGEWVKIHPEPLCYELSKRGADIKHILEILTKILRLTPEESVMIWRKYSI